MKVAKLLPPLSDITVVGTTVIVFSYDALYQVLNPLPPQSSAEALSVKLRSRVKCCYIDYSVLMIGMIYISLSRPEKVLIKFWPPPKMWFIYAKK